MSYHHDNVKDLSRRRFLSRASQAALATGASITAFPAIATEWTNWSGGQRINAREIAYPANEADLIKLVKSTHGPLRAVGGGHSFSPVVPTTGTIVSLEALNGLIRHDPATLQATLWAGTRVASASPLLGTIGQGFFNEADINMQSLGGAISTATHGTGRRLQCYSAHVRHLRLINANGDVIDCDLDHDRDLFEAARVAIGSLGIISQITFQNRTAYRLRETVKVMDLKDAMALVDKEKDLHPHIEFMGFPFGGRAIVKIIEETQDQPTKVESPLVDENDLLDFAADTARKHPWTNSPLQRLIGLFVSDSSRVGASYDIYPSPRAVQFNEMEYQLPAEHGMTCFEEVLHVMRQKELDVFFPLEFRYVKADDCWLSPFYQRDAVSISVHQYYKQDYRAIFKEIEPVFWKYQGRPHWGKVHTLSYAQLQKLYPRFEDFRKVRARVDPQGRFLNSHLKQIFAI